LSGTYIPDSFDSSAVGLFGTMLNFGKGTVQHRSYGKVWHMATLEAWEDCEVLRVTDRYYDPLTKDKHTKLEVLTRCIIAVDHLDKGGTHQVFMSSESKVILRTSLLRFAPEILDKLYFAYLVLKQIVNEKLDKEFPDLQKQLAKDFFEQLGSSSPDLASKTPTTQDGSDSSTVEAPGAGSFRTPL